MVESQRQRHDRFHNGPTAYSASAQNNPFCWSCEKALAGFDVPQRLVVNFSYQVPFDKAAPFHSKRLTQGWTFWGIGTASSGFPFTVVTPFGSAEYGLDTYAGATVRPNLVSTPTQKTGPGPEEQFFSNAVLQDSGNHCRGHRQQPKLCGAVFRHTSGHPGRKHGRSQSRKPRPQHVPPEGVSRSRPVTGQGYPDYRARPDPIPCRVLQHYEPAAFNLPKQTFGAPVFGMATATVFGPREIQFGLRFVFQGHFYREFRCLAAESLNLAERETILNLQIGSRAWDFRPVLAYGFPIGG
jgi:hypothetical protein